MFYARTPLLFLHLVAWTGFFASAWGMQEVFFSRGIDNDPWRSNPGMFPQFIQGIFFFFFLFVIALSVAEFRLARGWEPKFLEIHWIGMTVTDKNSADGKLLVAVKGLTEEHSFICDQEEHDRFEIGDIVHLWTIGPYVSRSIKVDEIQNYGRRRVAVDRSVLRWDEALMLILAGLTVGWFFWYASYGLSMQEITFEASRRRRFYGTGELVTLSGNELRAVAFTCLIVGLSLFSWLWYSLKRGLEAGDAAEALWYTSAFSRFRI